MSDSLVRRLFIIEKFVFAFRLKRREKKNIFGKVIAVINSKKKKLLKKVTSCVCMFSLTKWNDKRRNAIHEIIQPNLIAITNRKVVRKWNEKCVSHVNSYSYYSYLSLSSLVLLFINNCFLLDKRKAWCNVFCVMRDFQLRIYICIAFERMVSI